MRGQKVQVAQDIPAKRRPAMSEESREKQIIALTMDRVEERIRNGTASSAEYVHFLKLGSSKEKTELEKANEEIKLLKAKTEAIESGKNIEQLYSEAIKAMSIYAGNKE